MTKHLKLASFNGDHVIHKRYPRPFYTYYYQHSKALGFDKIGRATERNRAIIAAQRQMLENNYHIVEIYADNEDLVAVLEQTKAGITTRFRPGHIR